MFHKPQNKIIGICIPISLPIKKSLYILASFLLVFNGAQAATSTITEVTITDTTPGSVQYVNFFVGKSGTFTLRADGNNILGSGYNGDPYMYLFEGTVSASNLLASNDDFNGLSSQIVIVLTKGGYIIAVSEYDFSLSEAINGNNISDIDDPNTLIRVSILSPDGTAALLQDIASGLLGAGSTLSVGDFLTSLSFNGAHHRPLLTYHDMGKDKCVWLSGDFAHYSRNHDGDAGLAEIGACYDFIPEKLRFGVGIGQSFVNQNHAFNGENDLDGQYIIAEFNYLLPNLPVIASLTGMYGKWNADTNRAYEIGGTISNSFGDTDLTSYAIRGRLDWLNAFSYLNIGFTPRIAFTINRNEVDGYSETGGLLPAIFNSRSNVSKELRFGIDAEKQIGKATWLRGMVEGVHRFDDAVPSIRGTILGGQFVLPGGELAEDWWARIGMEVEHLIRNNIGISASINGSTEGEDPTVSGGVMVRANF